MLLICCPRGSCKLLFRGGCTPMITHETFTDAVSFTWRRRKCSRCSSLVPTPFNPWKWQQWGRAWLRGVVRRLHKFQYHGAPREPVSAYVPHTRKLRQSREYIYVNICTCPRVKYWADDSWVYCTATYNWLVNAVVAKLSEADRTPQRGSQEWLRLRSRCSRWGLATPYSYMQRRRKATSSLNWPGEW